MFNKLFKSEDVRRVINPNFDNLPTYIHRYNFESSKKYIKGKVVLDIGCWTGQLERLAYNSAKEIVAIDPNSEAISFAKKNIPEVKFKVGNARELPFLNSYFDTVMIMDVIEHVPKGTEMQVLKQIYKVIKPQGNLIISTPNSHPLSILLDPAYFLFGHRHYSLSGLSNMLIKAGFRIKEKRRIGNSYGLIYSNLSLLLKYTIGFEPNYIHRLKKFLLKQHAKDGFAFLFIIAEALKKNESISSSKT